MASTFAFERLQDMTNYSSMGVWIVEVSLDGCSKESCINHGLHEVSYQEARFAAAYLDMYHHGCNLLQIVELHTNLVRLGSFLPFDRYRLNMRLPFPFCFWHFSLPSHTEIYATLFTLSSVHELPP
jgi:hypothetical protein